MHYVTPLVVAILVWWLATGLVLIAARQASLHRSVVMALASVLALASVFALVTSAYMDSAAGSYLGFFSALGIWTWHETAFLTGYITGPSRSPCPENARGYTRFRAAFLAIRSHELAILATAIAMLALIADASNRTGLWTFLLLWLMRISAKLNLFMGAPNAINPLIPERLRYLTSYFRTDKVSPLFAFTIAVSVSVLAMLVSVAASADEPWRIVGTVLVATFLALAILEHLFLVFPVRDALLWSWAAPDAFSNPKTDQGHREDAAKDLGG